MNFQENTDVVASEIPGRISGEIIEGSPRETQGGNPEQIMRELEKNTRAYLSE